MSKKMAVWFGIVGLSACVSAGEVGKSTPKGFTDDLEAAKVEAAMADKKVLAVFSGSDWCHWCKVLEADYLSKPEFVDEAKKDFVLVFVDNPKDKSVLSEMAKKNNVGLTKKYQVRGFPTIKILDAKGEVIADSRPRDEVTPKGYVEQLRREVKVVPLVKKHLAPYADELEKLRRDFLAEMKKQKATVSSGKTGEEAKRAQFELSQKLARGMLAELKTLRVKAQAEPVPKEIENDAKALLEELDAMIASIEELLMMSWDDVKAMREKAGVSHLKSKNAP